VDTTILGMTVVDCWRAYKHAMPVKKRDITIKDFADQMAYDCIKNCHSDCFTPNGYLRIAEDDNDISDSVPNFIGGGRPSDISSVTEAMSCLSVSTIMAAHPFRDNPDREQGGTGRPMIRRHCRADDCRKTFHKMCFQGQCSEFRYKTSKGWVRGVFYCPDHYHVHYSQVLQNNGSV
jgi:hypothetical protein